MPCCINTNFINLAPTSVQNATVTVVGNMINITWSPPSITNGMILQYIVRRINSSGKSYYHVSENQNYLELPYFNDALVFVSAVNQYGQSSFEQAISSGMKAYTHAQCFDNMYFLLLHSSLSTISLY